MKSHVRLGVSPAAASAPTGVFNQRFEALFPHCWNSGLCGLSPGPAAAAAALPTQLHNSPPRWVGQPPSCHKSSLPQLPNSAPPTGLDECFFFISLVVGLPYSSIFCQFWGLLFLNMLLSFFWLCKEAKSIYLCLHLSQKSYFCIFDIHIRIDMYI